MTVLIRNEEGGKEEREKKGEEEGGDRREREGCRLMAMCVSVCVCLVEQYGRICRSFLGADRPPHCVLVGICTCS